MKIPKWLINVVSSLNINLNSISVKIFTELEGKKLLESKI